LQKKIEKINKTTGHKQSKADNPLKIRRYKMKRRLYILSQIIFLFILCGRFENKIYCQDKPQNTAQGDTIELSQGCKLIIDAKLNTIDTLSREIVHRIRNILPRIQKLIPADSVTIDLAISSENILPVWGVGGRTTSVSTDQHRVETVELYYDPNHSNFRVEFILRSLVHELHHVCRIRMPQFQLTLLECMVNEGLADHFMVEVLNCEQTPWGRALTEKEIQQYMIQIKPLSRIKHESWTEEFNEKYFVPWFFGRTGAEPIPGWTGYSLGWRIVENYLKAHPEARASSLVLTPPEVIVSSTPELRVSK
jgi:two-component sensor histidine kinase